MDPLDEHRQPWAVADEIAPVAARYGKAHVDLPEILLWDFTREDAGNLVFLAGPLDFDQPAATDQSVRAVAQRGAMAAVGDESALFHRCLFVGIDLAGVGLFDGTAHHIFRLIRVFKLAG